MEPPRPTPPGIEGPAAHVRRCALACAAAVIAIAGLALLGRIVGCRWLVDYGSNGPGMVPNTSIGLSLLAAAFGCAWWSRRWSRLPAALAACIGAGTLTQLVTGADLGFDNITGLSRDNERMACATAASLVGLAVIALWPRRAPSLVWLACIGASALTGLYALFQLTQDAHGVAMVSHFGGVAPNTAAGLLILCAAATLERSTAPWPTGWAAGVRAALMPGAVFLTGLSLTTWAACGLLGSLERAAEARFEHLAGHIREEMKRRMSLFSSGLHGARGLFAASGTVSRGAFRAYADSRDLTTGSVGALGVGYIERVARDRVTEFVAAARADGAPGFGVTTSGDLPHLYITKFVEPAGAASVGFDIGSAPEARAAADRAMHTGRPTLTAPLDLARIGGDRPGMLYLLPVYRNGAPTETVADREAACIGWTFSPIDAEAALAGVEHSADGMVSLEVLDNESGAGEVLFSHRPAGASRTGSAYSRDDRVIIGGRAWVVRTQATPEFDAAIGTGMLGGLLVAGLVATTLLTQVVRNLGEGRARAVAITEEMTRDLETQRERLEMALSGGDLGLWDWNPQTGRVFFDDRWASMLGERLSDLTPDVSEWSRRVHPDDLPRAESALRDHFEGRAPQYECEHRVRHRDGTWRWILDRGKVVARDAEGRPIRVVGTHLDTTHYHETKRRLEASERRTRAIIEGADVIAWEFDFDANRFTYISPQAAKLGYPLEDWSRPGFWQDHIHPDDRDETIGYCMRETRAGRNHRMQYRFLGADGAPIWLDDVVSVEVGPGDTRTLRGVLIDITESRRLRDEAVRASRAKSEFLANTSHEIRTPMTAILGYADLLAELGDGPSAAEQRMACIDTIRRNGRHLLTLINDILDLSKVEAGRMTVECLPTDPRRLLLEVESLMLVKARAKGVSLSVVQETPLPAVIQTDPVRLRQILVNLVGNAIKFTEQGGVTILAALDAEAPGGPLLRVRVRDTGVGMTPEQVGGLFRAFHQGDSSTTRQFGGTGLGLRISKSLVALLGGDITVESTPGRGSTFTATASTGPLEGVRLLEPATLRETPSADPPPAPGVRAAAPLAGLRILVAEDGPDNQRLITTLLRRAGAEVRVVENGRQALAALTQDGDPRGPLANPTRFDMVLTDVQMPEVDGYQLARTLRRRGWTHRIVALTAYATDGEADQCLQSGCDAYVPKPIDRARLIEACRGGAAGATVTRAA